MAGGICSKWNQPVYYGFDKKMNKKLLHEIIRDLEKVGFIVCCIVSDFDTANQGLWTELGISIGKTYFENPFDKKRKVWVFADIPHMLKLLRNHLIDQGFLLPTQTIINKSTLEKLVSHNGTELKLCPKLNNTIINLRGAARMRVAPAAKIFSAHTSNLCTFVFSTQPEISIFFKLVNDWFDVFNSRVAKDVKLPIKSAYGIEIVKQDKVLDNTFETISKMRCLLFSKKQGKMVARAGLLPFQTGILASIKSLKGMATELQQMYNVTYIKTYRLNQDAVESLFSEIRALGRTNDSPTAPDLRNRLKLLILGAKIRPPQNANVQIEKNRISYMSVSLLDQIKPDPRKDNNLADETKEEDLETDKVINEIKTTTDNDSIDIISETSLLYLAGYIGFLIKKSGGKDYGEISRKVPCLEQEKNLSTIAETWIHSLSRGGLIVPSTELASAIAKLEKQFTQHFPAKMIIRKPGILGIVQKTLASKLPNVDKTIVKLFANIRLKIRIKHLNSLKLKASHYNSENVMPAKDIRRNKKKAIQFVKGKVSKGQTNPLSSKTFNTE